jgi:hypothetical protein
MDWRPNVPIRGVLSQSAPALASHKGVLHMVHRGDDSNDLWHARLDGSNWIEYKIEGPATQSAPSLASHEGVLHMVHRGSDSNDLWHARWNGAQHWPEYQIQGQSSQSAPALASHEDMLHMVHQGDGSNSLWHSAFDGSSWTARGLSSSHVTSALNIVIPDQASKAPPALASHGDMLRMVHLGDGSNMIWYSLLDPLYTHPTCEIWADPPTVIGEPGSADHAIHALGHRRCSGTAPQAVGVTVRIRKDNRFWPDDTMAEAHGFGVNVDVPVLYTCKGRGSETVFAEVVLDDGQKAQSARVNVPLCS